MSPEFIELGRAPVLRVRAVRFLSEADRKISYKNAFQLFKTVFSNCLEYSGQETTFLKIFLIFIANVLHETFLP